MITKSPRVISFCKYWNIVLEFENNLVQSFHEIFISILKEKNIR